MSETKRQKTCENCAAFSNNGFDDDRGECHRHTPISDSGWRGWPGIRQSDWCLEWAETDEEKELRLIANLQILGSGKNNLAAEIEALKDQVRFGLAAFPEEKP